MVDGSRPGIAYTITPDDIVLWLCVKSHGDGALVPAYWGRNEGMIHGTERDEHNAAMMLNSFGVRNCRKPLPVDPTLRYTCKRRIGMTATSEVSFAEHALRGGLKCDCRGGAAELGQIPWAARQKPVTRWTSIGQG